MQKSNLEDFVFKDCIVAGDECILVNPVHIGAHWNIDNLVLRSCIYRKSDFFPISLSYCKFCNYGENPDAYPDPNKYKDWIVSDKLDGSLIIVSYYNNQLVVRTRGTSNIDIHNTASEIYELIDKTNIINYALLLSGKYTFLMEHITPNLPIVIKYDKPELIFLDIIRNEDYRIMPSEMSDSFANSLSLRRPDKFQFKKIEDIIKNCEILKGREGYVLSFNDDQNKVKIKSFNYLLLHKLKSELSSIDKVIDLWAEINYPDYQTFYNYLIDKFDFELVNQVQGFISRICDASNEVNLILNHMKKFVLDLAGKSRKDQALAILSAYGQTNRSSMAFIILDGKDIYQNKEMIKKLLYQCLKN